MPRSVKQPTPLLSQLPPSYPAGSPLAVKLIRARHYPAHRHDKELEIILCLEGTATVISAHDTFPIVAGQIITVDQDDVHCIYSDEDNLLAVFHLDLTRSEVYPFEDLRYRFIACATASCRPYNRQYLSEVRDRLLGILYASISGAPYTGAQYREVYESLLHILVDGFSWPYRDDLSSEANEEIKLRLHQINKYVQQHYKDHITIAQLSSRMNISENYFSQFMKKTSYGGFREMLAYVRCYNAELLLLESDLSGEEIASRCGFSSTKYYYRWFRHFWGRSPLQHKKWYRRYAAIPPSFTVYTPEEALPIVQRWLAEDMARRVFG